MAEIKLNKGIKIKCHSCNYEWITLTDMLYVSCPSCLIKVKVLKDGRQTKTNI
jgi:Zn finger protein HypA/HybF involved in hydrogenase expression